MRRTMVALLLAMVSVVGLTGPAAAYVGPGAGLSLVGAFWGLLVAVVAALGFIIFWPVRRLFRRHRAKSAPATAEAGAGLRKDDSAQETGASTS